jgi:hypothetical protein
MNSSFRRINSPHWAMENQLKRSSNEMSDNDGDRALFAKRLMKPSRHTQLFEAMCQAILRYKMHRRRLLSNSLQAFTFDPCLTIFRRPSGDGTAKYCMSSCFQRAGATTAPSMP